MPTASKKPSSPSAANAVPSGRPHTDTPVEVLRSLIQRHLVSTLARHAGSATPRDWWVATALAVRDTIHERMIATQAVHNEQNVRRIYYFSLEYLIGRLFGNNLLATGLFDTAKAALESLGQDFEAIRETEVDMGLGNGGLGRLAACFLDSLATLDYPALGYGIYYEFGLFKQEFVNGNQVEHPDNWIRFGDPWEVVRPEYTQVVHLYGRVENVFDDRGNYRPKWVDTKTTLGVPADQTPARRLAVRQGDRVHVYQNACPHIGTPLDWTPDVIFSTSSKNATFFAVAESWRSACRVFRSVSPTRPPLRWPRSTRMVGRPTSLPSRLANSVSQRW